MLSSLKNNECEIWVGFSLSSIEQGGSGPEGGALVDQEAAGADVPLGGGEGRVLCQLLLQRAEHGLLQLPDLLQVPQAVPICKRWRFVIDEVKFSGEKDTYRLATR